MAMADYLQRLVDYKQQHPGDDMLSAIVEAAEDADRLSSTKADGVPAARRRARTTVNLIGKGVLALLRHSPQLAELRADPDLTAGAFEELLRFDGPVNLATLAAHHQAGHDRGHRDPGGGGGVRLPRFTHPRSRLLPAPG
jgi:cytochrome P450